MNLAVFVKSLREHNRKCRIVIFLDENTYMQRSPLAKALCEKYDVTALPLTLSLLEPEEMRKYHPSTYRWPLLLNVLNASLEPKDPIIGQRITASTFGKVLLADIRDTAFSSDPFTIVETPGLYAFGEDTRIANEGWNSGWIKDCWGTVVLNQLVQKDVICSGIVMGTFTAVYAYLKAMTDKIVSADFQKCERNGVDQGIHNVVLHKNMVSNVIFHRQSNGVVAHMQANIMKHVSGTTEVRNVEGKTAIIVHQYDRDKDLMKELFSKWVDWDPKVKVKGTDGCENFELLKDGELFVKVGDFRDGNIYGKPDFHECCKECQNRPNECTSFVHVGKVCWLKSFKKKHEFELEIHKEARITPDVTSGWLAT